MELISFQGKTNFFERVREYQKAGVMLVIAGSRDDMQIFVKTFPGEKYSPSTSRSRTGSGTGTAYPSSSSTCSSTASLPLEGHCTHNEYKIQRVSTLHLVVRVHGGRKCYIVDALRFTF